MSFMKKMRERSFTEWIVPNIDAIEGLGRIELLIYQADNGAKFGVMLNRSDRCNPIPPDTFGVIIDPASDDRSIKTSPVLPVYPVGGTMPLPMVRF